MDDPEKTRSDYAAEEYVPPEPETDYLSPDGRIKIIIERRRFPGGIDNPPYTEESYSLFFDDRLIGGSDCGESIRAAAIEMLEAENEALKVQIRELLETIDWLDDGISKSSRSPRSQSTQTEPADRLEADQKSKLKEVRNEP